MAEDKTLKQERQDFDLFAAIEAADRKDYDYFNRLSPEQQAKFSPYMMLLWMATTKNNCDKATRRVNFYANKHMFNENINGRDKHPGLQWLMLCAAGTGNKQFHQWVPEIKKSVRDLKEPAKSKDVSDYFSKVYKGCSPADIKEITQAFIIEHEHKRRIRGLYPDMKVSDVEVLASIITDRELNEYAKQSGN